MIIDTTLGKISNHSLWFTGFFIFFTFQCFNLFAKWFRTSPNWFMQFSLLQLGFIMSKNPKMFHLCRNCSKSLSSDQKFGFQNSEPLMRVRNVFLFHKTRKEKASTESVVLQCVLSRFKKAWFKKESRFKKDCSYNRFFST